MAVGRDGELCLGDAVRARVELAFEAGVVERLPRPHVPDLHDVVLARGDHVAFVRGESGARHLVQVRIRNRVDHLCLTAAHVPEPHVLHVRRHHRGLGPRQVDVVDPCRALSHHVLASRDIPSADRLVVRSRDQALLVVIEPDACDQIGVPGVLLDPSRSLRAEELDLVLVD